MVKIKSFSIGNGDMFYIKHASQNFTIIDCSLPSDDDERKQTILDEVHEHKTSKEIVRFISTHPDQDHIQGLKDLDEKIDILNFYCVKNQAKKDDETDDFKHYCQLRDHTGKSFYLHRGCSRRWMNEKCEERDHAGIHILWPILENEYFKEALKLANNGESPNNISPIIKYSLNESATFIWMGDLEESFMENIIDEVDLPKANILFAPHHGRESGKIPAKWLEDMDPDIIVIGEAPSEDLDYYSGHNVITQNLAKNITFICSSGRVDVYSEDEDYSVDFLSNSNLPDTEDGYYIGTLNINS